MTLQTKRFIELGDMLAARFHCQRCETEISVPLGGDAPIHVPTACPSCNADWHYEENGGTETAVRELAVMIRRLMRYLPQAGFGFAIEISPDPAPAPEKKLT